VSTDLVCLKYPSGSVQSEYALRVRPGPREDFAVDGEFGAAVDAGRAGDEDAVWEILSAVVRKPDACGYGIARLHDPDLAVRMTACDLVGMAAEVSEAVRAAAVDALLTVVVPASVESLVWALGRTHDVRAVPRLLEFVAHSDAAVRLAVASSLPSVLEWGVPEPPEVIDALIVLTRDPDDDVRNWATFGLGELTDADGLDVRAALLDRVVDRFQDAREEGVCGLARRRDPHGIALLGALLAEESLQVGVFHVAALVGDPSYLPLLQAFDATDSGIADALRFCDPGRRAACDDFAWELMTAIAAVRPDCAPMLYCERFEPGIRLGITLADELHHHSVDDLMDATDGDVTLATARVMSPTT
jgi:hypothetical protein